MAEHKLDRRVQRTRALLREALFSLIEEKGYGAITIQDITDRANINRVTFYFHYKDKDDLTFHALQSLYEEIEASMPAPRTITGWMRNDAVAAFEHVQQYAHLYRVLLSEKASLSLLGRMIDYFAKGESETPHSLLPPDVEPPVPLSITEHFYAGAFVALVRWWVLNDMPYPPEYMAKLCSQLHLNSGLWALGLDDRDFTQT
jgi:AcrR family transcriptional regulator